MPRHGRSNTARSLFVHALLCGLLTSLGCITPWNSGKSEKDLPSHDWEKVQTVGDLTVPGGLNSAKVQGVTLATQLRGTGSDPPPSPARDLLLNEMRIRQIDQPQQWLASPNTSLVALEAVIPPGARKGDRVDIRVTTPNDSETTSLENGWIPETRLAEAAFLGGRIRTGTEIARATGPVVLDSVIDGAANGSNQKRGIILGGGILVAERPLGLGLIDGHVSVAASATIGSAINNRFYMYREGTKQGVATPKTDKFISLDVHPRYRGNISRYVRVVRYIPLSGAPGFRVKRLAELEAELLNESTAQIGAMKLEAMGKDAIPSLKKGLESSNDLVRFCAAEALAYLNEANCIEPLTEAARTNNGFRYRALLALGAFDDLEVIDSLESLLHAESAEARYGALNTLKGHSNLLPTIRGEKLDNGAELHFIRSAASPLIHFRLQDRAEIAIFGTDVRLEEKVSFIGPNGLTIRGIGPRKLKVTRFKPAGGELVEECSTEVTQLIKALSAVECGYGEIVKTIYSLRNEGFLSVRVEVNSIPRPDRSYLRSDESSKELEEADQALSEQVTDNFTQSDETVESEDSAEVETPPLGEDSLIPTFD